MGCMGSRGIEGVRVGEVTHGALRAGETGVERSESSQSVERKLRSSRGKERSGEGAGTQDNARKNTRRGKRRRNEKLERSREV